MRNTVAFAVDRVVAAASEGAPATVHFVVVESNRSADPDGPETLGEARSLLDRVALWAEEDVGDGEGGQGVEVETALVGVDEYLFSPEQYARALLEYAEDHAVDRIVLDPEYDPGTTAPMIWALDRELRRGDVPVEEASVDRPRSRTVLARTLSGRKYLAVFGVSFLFYLALGTLSTFDVVTGAVAATVVAVLLAPVAFGTDPPLGRLFVQTGRMVLYTPYLLWEITKANVQIAAVVLHPSLPIDPEMVEFRAAIWGDVPVTTLANSITLTPGTLTVDVAEGAFTIHTLTGGSRQSLMEGSLERAVRFVFFGRAAARIPSPREREAWLDDSTEERPGAGGDTPP